MNTIEEWVPLPLLLNGESQVYTFSTELLYDGSLVIYLHGKDDTVDYHKLIFPGPVYHYRVTDESYRLKLFSQAAQKYGSKEGFVFDVLNSEYKQEVQNFFPPSIHHFVVMTVDVIIDVLSEKAPYAESLKVKKPVRHVSEIYNQIIEKK